MHHSYRLILVGVAIASGVLAVFVPENAAAQADPSNRRLIERGRELFMKETFEGNGRTCASCHPPTNNFTIDPAFIATLPDDDPLFVAEFNPDLAELEDPELMRRFGLITENADGFDRPGVLRGVPHTLGLRISTAVNPAGEEALTRADGSTVRDATGWSGDGAPGNGSLHAFATGAVIQHFTKTMNRVAGEDFRLPTKAELDALEAFQLSLGRQKEIDLATMNFSRSRRADGQGSVRWRRHQPGVLVLPQQRRRERRRRVQSQLRHQRRRSQEYGGASVRPQHPGGRRLRRRAGIQGLGYRARVPRQRRR